MAIGQYLKDLRGYPLLTEEQEVELGKQVRAGEELINVLIRYHPELSERKKRELYKTRTLQYVKDFLLEQNPSLDERVRTELRVRVADYETARNAFICSNLRLVVNISNAFAKSYQEDLEELVQYGNEGLIHAVSKYDPEKGYRFSTYASWWIRQSISRGLMNSKLARLPIYRTVLVSKVKNIIRQILLENRPVNLEEIAVILNESMPVYSTKQVRELVEIYRKAKKRGPNGGSIQYSKALLKSVGVVLHTYEKKCGKRLDYQKFRDLFNAYFKRFDEESIERLMQNLGFVDLLFIDDKIAYDTNSNTKVDSLEDVKAKNLIEKRIADIENKAIVELGLECLDSRENHIIISRFGLHSKSFKTLKAISSDFNITTERIRQLEKKSLAKMKEHLLKIDVNREYTYDITGETR